VRAAYAALHVLTAVASDETLLALPFLELPSRTLYPDYYTTIRRPMCLHDIERRLEKRAYASFGEVRADCETVCGNAKRFNLRDSPIWLKARALHVSLECGATAPGRARR